MRSQNMPVQRLELAILPLYLTCSGLVTHSGEILTTGKSHTQQPDGLFSKDDSEMKKVLRFKYATWNVSGPGETEENIKISVITESKKKNC